MKSGTKYWLGIRNVGEADWPELVQESSAADMCRTIVRVIGQTTLASRLDIVIARDEATVRRRLDERLNQSGRKKVDQDADLLAELEAMMADSGMEDL